MPSSPQDNPGKNMQCERVNKGKLDEVPLSCKDGIQLKTLVPIIINGDVVSPTDAEVTSVGQM